MTDEPTELSPMEMLGMLSAFATMHKCQKEIIYRLVESLRRKGVGWDEIAQALDVTRQAASEKHRREQERRQQT